jgi:Ser/Thr protein kinase RdoA (MazF antagonist)
LIQRRLSHTADGLLVDLQPERTDRQDKPRESVDSGELDPLVTLFNSEPWRMDNAERAAQEALRGLGHAGTELRLIRLGENALFHAPALEALLRVARPQKPPRAIAGTITLARLLRAEGIPAPEPLTYPGLVQPFVSPLGTVTFWRYYKEDRSRRFSLEDFGRLLREFHARGSVFEHCLPKWRPLEHTRRRLDEARQQAIPPGWLRVLSGRMVEVDEGLQHLRSELGHGAVHGDAHRGNLLLTTEGPVLLDLDEVCVAPREWDLTPTLVARRRFGLSQDHWASFSTAYGYDLLQSPAARPLVWLRELAMTTWLLQQYGATREIDEELERRIASLEEDDHHWTTWNRF